MTMKPGHSKWMENLPDNLTRVPLNSLAIPGSHDSFSYSLDSTLGVAVDESELMRKAGVLCCVTDILEKWNKTQSLDFQQQLESGVRYFDFRVCVHPKTKEFRFLHSLYADNILVALKVIKSFLDKNVKEVVLLDFNHFYNMTDSSHRELVTGIKTLFGDYLFMGTEQQLFMTSLRDCWDAGTRAIVFYHDVIAATQPGICSGSAISSPWPRTNDPATLVRFLENKYSEGYRDGKQLYVWQGVLTPTRGSVAVHPCGSLEHTVAPRATDAFCNWLEGKRTGPKEINICLGDFIEEGNFIESVLILNRKAE